MIKFIRKYVFFIIAGVLLLTSILHMAFLVVSTIEDWDSKKLTFPGTSQLELNPGKYMICYEYDNHKVSKQLGVLTIETGTEFNLNSSDIQAEAMNVSHHTEIELRPDQSFSYAINNKSGNSLYSLHVKEQGNYQFNLQHIEIRDLELITITLLPSPVSNILGMFKWIVIYTLLIIIFVIAGVFTLLRANKNKRVNI